METEETCSLSSTNESTIGTSCNEDIIYPEFAEFAFGRFSQQSKPRCWLLKLITYNWFHKLTLFFILTNCITMSLNQSCSDGDRKNSFLKYVDNAIFIYFLFEMLVKIFAMGFVGKKTYLADRWNIIDFVVVIAG